MYSKNQRRVALFGVILLLLLYATTFIAAIFNFDGSGNLFKACLFATIAMPILIWVYIGLYGAITKKRTMATLFQEVEGLEEAKQKQFEEIINNSDTETTKKENS
ncbi:MAG: hypothetical protein IJN92_03210 [Lachnospiraceae bacterium]|nr:hypothetical protein [Lachnospiraceae bacterium]